MQVNPCSHKQDVQAEHEYTLKEREFSCEYAKAQEGKEETNHTSTILPLYPLIYLFHLFHLYAITTGV
jgi:hypothetical protein